MLFAAFFSAAFASPSAVDTYFARVWSEGDTSNLEAVVTDDFRGITMAAGQQEAVGPEGLAGWVGGVRKFLPDGRKVVQSQVERGDQVVVHVTMTASHPSGGDPIVVDQVHWLTLRDGRIASDQVYFDLGTVMAALKGE